MCVGIFDKPSEILRSNWGWSTVLVYTTSDCVLPSSGFT